MATVVLKNVKKIYNGGVLAVHDFNLSIKDKEFIVFVGPSGCGKSTTLRMVAGLEEISEGECYIDDVLVNDRPPKERGISMVFQNYALYPHLTVYENMAFPLRLLRGKEKMSNDEIYQRVTDAAKTLGITQYLARKPKNLSGGQRQRVAIGRAMVRPSKVFMMDEPLSNLDAKLRNQMRAEIILLRKKIDSTFIYVTHDQTEAMTLGDRIVIMKDGFIMQVGTPTEVFDRPANLFVAEFIGAPKMNTFPAKLVKDGYNDKTLSATLTIGKATFSGYAYESKSVSYDGAEHINDIQLVGMLPQGTTVDEVVRNSDGEVVSSAIEVGTYDYTCTIANSNFNTLTLVAQLTIKAQKKDMPVFVASDGTVSFHVTVNRLRPAPASAKDLLKSTPTTGS